jgi:FMN phosphatase YigB (HAD superfamily)
MIRSIALDIGGVCIKLHFDKTLELLGCTGLEAVPLEFVAATDMLEMGKMTVPDWLNVFHEITDNQFTNRELRDAWSMIIGNDIDGMSELAQELVDSGYRLVFFSDTSEIHMQEVYRKLSFANLVTGCIFSYETGFKKPAPEMYAEFERQYGKPVFYADDRPGNIDGGIRSGWQSHLFISAANMRSELVKNGILS